VCLLKGNEAAVDHFVESGKNSLDAFSVFNHLDNDWEVLGKPEDLVSVIAGGRSVAARASKTVALPKILGNGLLFTGSCCGASVPTVDGTRQGRIFFD
jgi:hypothetical protein